MHTLKNYALIQKIFVLKRCDSIHYWNASVANTSLLLISLKIACFSKVAMVFSVP